jgi:hypothetical protein
VFKGIVLLLGVSHCLAASDPVQEVTSLTARVGNQLIPAFYDGYIYWIGMAGGDRRATIYAPDGHLAFSFDTQNGAVENIAVDTDGSVAIAWQSQKSAGIDLRDRSGTLTRTIQTGRYGTNNPSKQRQPFSIGSKPDSSSGVG